MFDGIGCFIKCSNAKTFVSAGAVLIVDGYNYTESSNRHVMARCQYTGQHTGSIWCLSTNMLKISDSKFYFSLDCHQFHFTVETRIHCD